MTNDSLEILGNDIDGLLGGYVEIAKACWDESADLAWHIDGSALYMRTDVVGGRRLAYLYYLGAVEGRGLWRVWSVTKVNLTEAKAVTFVEYTARFADLQDMARLFKAESERNGIAHEVLPLSDFEATLLKGNVALLKEGSFEFCDRKGNALKDIIAF